MDAETLGLDHYPVMDGMVAAMILPDKKIVGKVPRLKPGPERGSNEWLQSTFRTLSIMPLLVNTATMLQSYFALLILRLPGGGEGDTPVGDSFTSEQERNEDGRVARTAKWVLLHAFHSSEKGQQILGRSWTCTSQQMFKGAQVQASVGVAGSL